MHEPDEGLPEYPAAPEPAGTGPAMVRDGWGYSVPELLGIAREHGLPVPDPMTHQGLAAALADHEVPLPRKI